MEIAFRKNTTCQAKYYYKRYVETVNNLTIKYYQKLSK
jgi:hypothetical protein